DRALRGRPRLPAARRNAGAALVAERAERALRRRARLGAHRRRASRHGPRVGAARAAARLARPAVPLPRRDGGACRRRPRRGADVSRALAEPQPALLAAVRAEGEEGAAMKRVVVIVALAMSFLTAT